MEQSVLVFQDYIAENERANGYLSDERAEQEEDEKTKRNPL